MGLTCWIVKIGWFDGGIRSLLRLIHLEFSFASEMSGGNR